MNNKKNYKNNFSDNLLSIKIAGVEFKNPLIAASGCYGYGREYEHLYPLSVLGGISCKGTTVEKRNGNLPPRIAETSSGILNSVGLQNPGVDYFIENEIPYLKSKDVTVIANIAGSTVEEYGIMAEKLDSSGIDMLEVNISCPNVKEGGVAFGTSCENAGLVTKTVKAATKKPVIIKLSPNVTSIADIAKSVEAEGADAVSLINTVLGMKIDINTRRPVLCNNVGGLSGPAIFPVALRMVWQTASAVKIPVIGMGGIEKWQDAVEMMLAGASAFQVGTAFFGNPYVPVEIVRGLREYLEKNKIENISSIVGQIILN